MIDDLRDGVFSDHNELVDWAKDIFDEHDLHPRADSALAAVVALLADAGIVLADLSHTADDVQAVTPAAAAELDRVIRMVEDVKRLAEHCPKAARSLGMQACEVGDQRIGLKLSPARPGAQIVPLRPRRAQDSRPKSFEE